MRMVLSVPLVTADASAGDWVTYPDTAVTAGTAFTASSTVAGDVASADATSTPNAADTRVFDGPAVQLTRNSVFETGTDEWINH